MHGIDYFWVNIGIIIEYKIGTLFGTEGDIFQIVLTNSRSMIEKGFITETTGDFFNGDIHLGFNI